MILWNGTNLRSKGIIVEKTPTISKAKKRIDTYQVSGRNGVLVVDNGTYDTFVVSVECHFDLDNYTLESINAFLDGYGTLSFDGVKQYHAYVKNAIEYEKVQHFKKFVVQFECNPIAEDIEETEFEVSSSPSSLIIADATYQMNPIIYVRGKGDMSFTINNKTFYIYGGTSYKKYFVDCENKVITDSSGNNMSSSMNGDFISLRNGLNSIEYAGDITAMSIYYKKAYL